MALKENLKKLTSTSDKDEFVSTLESTEELEARQAFDEAQAQEGGMTDEQELWFRTKNPEWFGR